MTWCDDTMISGLFTEVNHFRSLNGVAALSMSSLGMKDAELRATQFASYMTTHTPGSPGFNPHQGWDTTAAGIGYNVVGENLAYITIDPVYVVYGAWNDPLHIAAMLDSSATVAGVSCVFYNGTAYWTYEPGSCTGTACGGTPNPVPPPTGTPTLDSEEWAFLTLINNYRSSNGLGTLQVSATLENASLWMSNDMATNNYANHTDNLGRTTGSRLAAFGYSYSPWGENIAGGYPDAASAFNQWLTACDPDPSGTCTYAHRKNMLNPAFAAIGIGRAYSASSTFGWYWVTDFGGVVDTVISPPGGTPVPVITSFAASPSTSPAGQSSTLTWAVTGATSIRIDNGVGTVTGKTSAAVSPASTTVYTLTASNAAGSATAKVTVSVGTAADTQPPTAPGLSSAMANGPTEVDLTWTPSTDNVAVAGYQILRNSVPVASLSGAVLSYADRTATPATTYTYTIRAFDAAGNFSNPSAAKMVTTPAPPPPAGNCPGPTNGAFTGCYYNNLTMTGNPALVRTDSQINFDWTYGSPDPSISAGNFSVRWQGNFTFAQGTYTFSVVTSDGMRLYIDGNVVLDRWRDQATTLYRTQQTLTAGTHLITVEYYDHTGWPTAHLAWQNNSPVAAPSILSFSAAPAAITAGQTSLLSWSVNGATSVSIDNGIGDVSGLTSRPVSPALTTTYTLTASNSGGSVTARATVAVTATADTQPPTAPVLTSALAQTSNQVVLAWTKSTDNVGVVGYRIYRNGLTLASVAGSALSYSDNGASPNTTYTYAVQAYDAAGNNSPLSNSVQVVTPVAPPSSSSCPGPASNGFTACYYTNTTLTGNPAVVRTDSQINFDWGSGSPDAKILPGDFSARWEGYFNFNQATYTFTILTSDGMRVYVDGNLIFDRWRDQAATMYTVRQALSAGPHLVRVEYYEHTGWPTAHVTWQ